MDETGLLLIKLASVFVLGVGAQCLAWWVRVPSILMLLLFGFLAGPVFGFLQPDALLGELLFPLVSLSVAVILFEGSLSLRLSDLRGIGQALTNLLTIGVMVTWTLTTMAAFWILNFDFALSLLLGAILTVTGPTVVGPMLQHIRPEGRIGPVTKWEGIVVDPIGAVLAVLVLEAIEPLHSLEFSSALYAGLMGLIRTLAVGGGAGILGAGLLIWLMFKHFLPEHLHSPIALLLVVTAFGISNHLQHESGLYAVTVMGVILANQSFVSIKGILEFKESLSLLLISTLFILLSSRLELKEFTSLGWNGPLFVVVVILLVRPISVFLSTWGTGLTWQEQSFLAWMAPRGIVAASVSSVFALHLGDQGTGLAPATFLVIVGTVVIYGLTAPKLAVWLGLAKPNPQGVLIASAHPGARAIAHALRKANFRVLLVDNNRWYIRQARLEGLETIHANILSDLVADRLNLGGIGYFMAMTPNDEVNSLAALHFSNIFSKSNVFQLAPHYSKVDRQETSAQLLQGRILFEKEMPYPRMDERFAKGAIIKTTRLTKEFNYDAFRQHYGNAAVLLFVVNDLHELTIVTAEQTVIPKPGNSVIFLVDAHLQEQQPESEPVSEAIE